MVSVPAVFAGTYLRNSRYLPLCIESESSICLSREWSVGCVIAFHTVPVAG